MSISKTIVLSLFASCLLFLSNCKKDPKPSPCEGKSLPKADFILAEKLEGEERYFETDKINFINDLFLRGPEGYDEYLWQVSTNLNWSTNKNAKVSFSQSEGMLKVRLIAKRKPQTECFPNDDGIDTIEKFIDVVEKTLNNQWISPLQGYWEGKSTQYGNSVYTIWFESKDSLATGGLWNNFLYNLTNNCTSDRRTFAGYIMWKGQAAYIRQNDNFRCVFDYIAYTFPNNKDSIVVEYKVQGPAPNYKMIPYTFTGKRK